MAEDDDKRIAELESKIDAAEAERDHAQEALDDMTAERDDLRLAIENIYDALKSIDSLDAMSPRFARNYGESGPRWKT